MRRVMFILFMALLVTACATYSAPFIRSTISVFHELDATGKTYALVPFKEQEDSLEHKTYENIVKQELNAKGFKEVPFKQAEILVFISYGIDAGKQVVTSSTVHIRMDGKNADTEYEHFIEYTRFLKLDIVTKTVAKEQKPHKIYEAKVISSGSGQLAAALPTMIKSLFEDFPGESGSSRTVLRLID